MELIYPSYYHEFRCIAGACPDSCCHEWDVQVDEASASRYRSLCGPLGDALRAAMYEEDGEIYLRNSHGRCPMWRRDGLCRIQAELDHDALCKTCREFPRLRQDYGDFVELGLEMSCPEAARIMLTQPMELVRESRDGGEAPDYDGEVMDILRRTRPEAMAILDNGAYAVPQRLALLLLYGYHVQAQIDGAEETAFDPAAALAEAENFAGEGDREALVALYRELEILTRRWETRLSGARTPRWQEQLCRFARYGVYRYYFQAVSDYDLVCRVKLILAGCILCAMIAGDDLTGAVQLYSKEIENDAANIDTILDSAYTTHALTDKNLLGLLLNTP